MAHNRLSQPSRPVQSISGATLSPLLFMCRMETSVVRPRVPVPKLHPQPHLESVIPISLCLSSFCAIACDFAHNVLFLFVLPEAFPHPGCFLEIACLRDLDTRHCLVCSTPLSHHRAPSRGAVCCELCTRTSIEAVASTHLGQGWVSVP